ncbi:MAG TPA: FecR domain-containing protein [Stellaceae bacterium]|nr:FecR domain-containing protein [Stellaceae bacterium]
MATDISAARAAFLALFFAIGAAGPVAAQQHVGVNSAVNPEATGIPPNAPPRRLVVGQPVIFNEHVTTNPAGQTQILFVDASSMSIGPNSDLVINQFVYNPSTGTGRMAANLARGVFRYIGGKLSKEPNGVSMTTTAAAIGIRGGVLLVDVALGGRTEVIFEYGRGVAVMGRNGVSQTITRPGYEVIVAGPGASPSAPFPVPPGTTARLLLALDGRSGAHGGALVVPTGELVARSGLARIISANLPASIAAARLNRPPPAAPPVVTVTFLKNRADVNTAALQGAPLSTRSGIGTGLTIASLQSRLWRRFMQDLPTSTLHGLAAAFGMNGVVH